MAYFFDICRQFLARLLMPHRGYPTIRPNDDPEADLEDHQEDELGEEELNLQLEMPLAERRANLAEILYRIHRNPAGFRRWLIFNMAFFIGLPFTFFLVGLLLIMALHWFLN